MLKAWVRVSDVARYQNCHPPTIQRSEIVTRLLGQLRIDEGLVSQEWRPTLRGNLYNVDCVSTIFTSTISFQAGYCQCQTNSRAPRVICF